MPSTSIIYAPEFKSQYDQYVMGGNALWQERKQQELKKLAGELDSAYQTARSSDKRAFLVEEFKVRVAIRLGIHHQPVRKEPLEVALARLPLPSSKEHGIPMKPLNNKAR